MASLIFSIEKDNDIVVPVVGTVTLGRADGNDVLVDDASISATHAEVSQSEQGYWIKDLGSRSGTFVNGKRVRTQSLKDGDLVSFGALRGRFALDDADKKTPQRASQEGNGRARQTDDVDAGYEAALSRHQTLLGVLKELGDEEKRRMANLEQLHLAVTVAQSEQRSHQVAIDTLVAREKRMQERLAKLEAAVADREQSRAHLDSDLSGHEVQLAAAADLLRQHQAEEQALVGRIAALRKEAASAEAMVAEKARLQTSVTELQARHDKLVAALATVERAVADMERRQAEGVAHLRDREGKLRRTAKEIEEASGTRDSLLKELNELATRRAALEADLGRLAARVPGAEARLADLAVLTQAREDQVRAAELRLQQAEQRRREIEQLVESHATTEASLLQVRSELEKLTGEHAAMQAFLAARDEKVAELRSVEARLLAIAPVREDAERQLAAARAAFEKFQADAALARSRSEAGLQELEKQSAAEREKLARAAQQLRETLARNEDLQTQNRKLEGMEGKLREARTLLSQTVTRQGELEARSAAIEKEHQESAAKLGRLHAEVKTVEKSIESLRDRESAVKQEIEELRRAQAAEQRRVEETNRLVADTEAHAAVHRARLDANIEQRQRELTELEGRCESLRTIHEDIDSRYQKLATLKPGSPEALAVWQSAQEKKASLDSASPGEGGIRAKPQVRTVLVPRVREN